MQEGLAIDRRIHWRKDNEMDAFSRALAVWSQPSAVLLDEEAAKSLFLLCTESNVRRTEPSRPLFRALNLLDTAFAAAVQAKATEAFILLLKAVWDAAAHTGRIQGIESYVDSFELLSRAAQSEQGRDELSRNPVWKTSRSAIALPPSGAP